ncbi:PREDICTED: uncharacterized protein At4g37920, chloroplastic isoform X1 [Nicotiana attenuata]|uniref:Uncharacterized protein, chloroplastic n=1 Tax=Nicotiana attenuata TaxID=49451 RepID=A0A1J6KKG1_NICAT|nr:PREDICTED: uncharacterized protein At4g37920, chloroplastic isoform X1 [Nicotiana attenuata]OIT19737.1 uncharacterized protein, chloroplastic [Nicotiana attenuata]
MTHFLSLETSISATTNLSLFHTPFSPSNAVILPLVSPKSLALPLENSKKSASRIPTRTSTKTPLTKVLASGVSATSVEGEADVEVAQGFTITQFCDKMIDLFLNEKPKSKEWRKYLVFREEWKKYRDRFYSRCQTRADAEADSQMKEKLITLARKVRKIDDELERHTELLKEIQDNPRDLNAIVTKRRKDFTGEFFRHLTLLSEVYDSLEERDAIARLGTRCLSAVSAYDNTLEIVGTLDTAQAKFDDILNSPSIDAACEKIKSLAKSKELDSSLVLLINGAWASAKESSTMRNEVKEIMQRLYKATQSSLRSMAPKEIKLLKYLLNITDPEERFSALATAFSPGHEHDAKDPNAIYTTPKELHKWIKIMLDAYNLNKEETEIREAKQINQPVVIQRLFILKETIEAEYLEKEANTEKDSKPEEVVI